MWDREALFESGALTLSELLAQVPGATMYTSGFIASVSATSWYGEPGRVRVFLDGVELDPLDLRTGGTADLGTMPIFALEEVAVERAAAELRVHLRSWRVRLTTPQTRTDIVTGTENLNLYRGFFGKRMARGGVLQVAGQQYSTTNGRTRGDGDALSGFLRLGKASGRLSVDAVALHHGRNRAVTRRYVLSGAPEAAAIGGFVGRDLTAYLRAAWGSADSAGIWWQAIAATVQHVEDDSVRSTAAVPDADTVVTQAQYIATIGLTRGPLRLAATGRARAQWGEMRIAPQVRAAWEQGWLHLAATAETGGPDSTARVDGIARLAPVPWLHVGAAFSSQTPEDEAVGGPARTAVRGEAGVRLFDRWVTAAVVSRSAGQVLGMPAFDTTYVGVTRAAATGLEVGASGPIFGPFAFAWRGLQWQDEAIYRPQVESHAEIRVVTSLKERLPRAHFLLTAAVSHDYRSGFDAPDGLGGLEHAEGEGAYSFLLEIRLGAARVFWYNRNFVGNVYETVPGYLMPRLVQLYGVRWEFWN